MHFKKLQDSFYINYEKIKNYLNAHNFTKKFKYIFS